MYILCIIICMWNISSYTMAKFYGKSTPKYNKGKVCDTNGTKKKRDLQARYQWRCLKTTDIQYWPHTILTIMNKTYRKHIIGCSTTISWKKSKHVKFLLINKHIFGHKCLQNNFRCIIRCSLISEFYFLWFDVHIDNVWYILKIAINSTFCLK